MQQDLNERERREEPPASLRDAQDFDAEPLGGQSFFSRQYESPSYTIAQRRENRRRQIAGNLDPGEDVNEQLVDQLEEAQKLRTRVPEEVESTDISPRRTERGGLTRTNHRELADARVDTSSVHDATEQVRSLSASVEVPESRLQAAMTPEINSMLRHDNPETVPGRSGARLTVRTPLDRENREIPPIREVSESPLEHEFKPHPSGASQGVEARLNKGGARVAGPMQPLDPADFMMSTAEVREEQGMARGLQDPASSFTEPSTAPMVREGPYDPRGAAPVLSGARAMSAAVPARADGRNAIDDMIESMIRGTPVRDNLTAPAAEHHGTAADELIEELRTMSRAEPEDVPTDGPISRGPRAAEPMSRTGGTIVGGVAPTKEGTADMEGGVGAPPRLPELDRNLGAAEKMSVNQPIVTSTTPNTMKLSGTAKLIMNGFPMGELNLDLEGTGGA